MLDVGDHAPGFTLPDHDGHDVRLSDLLSGGPVVLAFYPADFTPLCTKQACDMRDALALAPGAGSPEGDQPPEVASRVLGITGQPPGTHAKFRDRLGLPYRLLADDGRRVARAYGVAGPLGLVPRRVSFLIERDGRIGRRVVADLRSQPHAALVAELAARLAGSPRPRP